MDQLADLHRLSDRLDAATGADRRLGGDLLRVLTGESTEPDANGDPTASVDVAISLINRVLPGWRWHVGYSANGITPYAVLRANGIGNGNGARSEATAPTVPLALLRALVKALQKGK